MEVTEIMQLLSEYQVNTYAGFLDIVCNRCNQDWYQRIYDGHSADELFIAALSHFDKVHLATGLQG